MDMGGVRRNPVNRFHPLVTGESMQRDATAPRRSTAVLWMMAVVVVGFGQLVAGQCGAGSSQVGSDCVVDCGSIGNQTTCLEQRFATNLARCLWVSEDSDGPTCVSINSSSASCPVAANLSQTTLDAFVNPTAYEPFGCDSFLSETNIELELTSGAVACHCVVATLREIVASCALVSPTVVGLDVANSLSCSNGATGVFTSSNCSAAVASVGSALNIFDGQGNTPGVQCALTSAWQFGSLSTCQQVARRLNRIYYTAIVWNGTFPCTESDAPTAAPTTSPTAVPSAAPTVAPTPSPTATPSATPTAAPTTSPTAVPSATPTTAPTTSPTAIPSATPTIGPTKTPTGAPVAAPTTIPSAVPTAAPTASPTAGPTTVTPTAVPTPQPTLSCVNLHTPLVDTSEFYSTISYPTECQRGPAVSVLLFIDKSGSISESDYVLMKSAANATAMAVLNTGYTADVAVSVMSFDVSPTPIVRNARSMAQVAAAFDADAGPRGSPGSTWATATAIASSLDVAFRPAEADAAGANVKIMHIVSDASWAEPCSPSCVERAVRVYTDAGWLVLVSAVGVQANFDFQHVQHLQHLTSPRDAGCFRHPLEWTLSRMVAEIDPRVDVLNVTLSIVPSFSDSAFESEMRGTTVAIVNRLVLASSIPCLSPTASPTALPTFVPTMQPSAVPTGSPTTSPSATPTMSPTEQPTVTPSAVPTRLPSATPTISPSARPSSAPTTRAPTDAPTPSTTATTTMTTTQLDTPCTTGHFAERDVFVIVDNTVRSARERRYLHELVVRVAESIPLDGTTVRLDVLALAAADNTAGAEFSHLRQCTFTDARAVSDFVTGLSTRLDVLNFPLNSALQTLNSTVGFGRWHAHPSAAGPTLAQHPHAHHAPLILFLTTSRTPSCATDLYRCNDGMCIDSARVCDRNFESNRFAAWPDCYDGSDEPASISGARDYILGCPDRNMPGPFANEICVDIDGWTDAHGSDCGEYDEQDYCTFSGMTGAGWNPRWGTIAEHENAAGIDGVAACCVCGGGNRSTAQVTRTELTVHGLLAPSEAGLPATLDNVRRLYGADIKVVAVGNSQRYDLEVTLQQHTTTVDATNVAAYADNITRRDLCATSAPPSSEVLLTCDDILTCPNNCGDPTQGGGTCRHRSSDGSTLCTSCNSDKFLWRGRCNVRIDCLAGQIRYGRLRGESCRCEQRDECYSCSREASGDTCHRCRNGFYLLNNECVPTCPVNMSSSGISLWGRRCLAPHVCRSNAIGVLDTVGMFAPAGLTYGCKCPDPGNQPESSCFMCEHRAGGSGEYCLRCRGGRFLYNNSCHASCADGGAPADLASYIPGNYGRECRAPFVCDDRLDEQGQSCKCPKTLGDECLACSYSVQGASCVQCQTGFSPVMGGGCMPTTLAPTGSPSQSPSGRPTIQPSSSPTERPTPRPTQSPTEQPTTSPSSAPTVFPSASPTPYPTPTPTDTPTSLQPTNTPTESPTPPSCNGRPDLAGCVAVIEQIGCQSADARGACTLACNACTWPPTLQPSPAPTAGPTMTPSSTPTNEPTPVPTWSPTNSPTVVPSHVPSLSPTRAPTSEPTAAPTWSPTSVPTTVPSYSPSHLPTRAPITKVPTATPTDSPTTSPTLSPTSSPTFWPTTTAPSARPTAQPSRAPTAIPSHEPTVTPTTQSPTYTPTVTPTEVPTARPTTAPIAAPTAAPSVPTCNGIADLLGCAGVALNGCSEAAELLCPAHCNACPLIP
eukprot:m.146735 g.146735  ORF g.146735 m.146735 type:complete len:1732 (-) comp23126_c1_seq1:3177-8372(-)